MKTHAWIATGLGLFAAGLVWAAGDKSVPQKTMPEPPAPQAFATPDGAFVVIAGEQLVDPYFVNKAMIVGMQAGLDLREPLQKWLMWLLPRQRADGGFDRYCDGVKTGKWRVCAKADADDSMAATLIHMVAMASARGWITAGLKDKSSKAVVGANRMLASLYNPANGLYRVFPNVERYYLMDSAEVYEGLVATQQKQAADKLLKAIWTQFHAQGRWEPAIPHYDKDAFYPHTLASAYLWGMPLERQKPKAQLKSDIASWLSHHSAAWLTRRHDPYSWGLVAWQLRREAPLQTGCWRQSVRPYSSAVGWTVLDAFIDQSLAHLDVRAHCPAGLLPKPQRVGKSPAKAAHSSTHPSALRA